MARRNVFLTLIFFLGCSTTHGLNLQGDKQLTRPGKYVSLANNQTTWVPGYMWTLYEGANAQQTSPTCRKKTYVSLPNEGPRSFYGCGTNEVTFNLEGDLQGLSADSLSSADLFVEILPKDNTKGFANKDLNKYRMMEATVSFTKGYLYEILKQNLNGESSVGFDMTSLIKEWIGTKTNLSLELNFPMENLLSLSRNRKAICKNVQWTATLLLTQTKEDCNSHPNSIEEFLKSSEMQGFKSRQIRDTKDYFDSQHWNCQLVPFSVNFNDIALDTVIAPTKYMANTCSGVCTTIPDDDLPLHAFSAMLLKSHGKGKGACCVPTHYESLQVLTYLQKEDRVIIKELPDLVATKCGCR